MRLAYFFGHIPIITTRIKYPEKRKPRTISGPGFPSLDALAPTPEGAVRHAVVRLVDDRPAGLVELGELDDGGLDRLEGRHARCLLGLPRGFALRLAGGVAGTTAPGRPDHESGGLAGVADQALDDRHVDVGVDVQVPLGIPGLVVPTFGVAGQRDRDRVVEAFDRPEVRSVAVVDAGVASVVAGVLALSTTEDLHLGGALVAGLGSDGKGHGSP